MTLDGFSGLADRLSQYDLRADQAHDIGAAVQAVL